MNEAKLRRPANVKGFYRRITPSYKNALNEKRFVVGKKHSVLLRNVSMCYTFFVKTKNLFVAVTKLFTAYPNFYVSSISMMDFVRVTKLFFRISSCALTG